MDILFIYNGYKQSESLMYAMRSLDKYCLNVGRVFIVADFKPEWLSDEVTYIERHNNPSLYKENDITEALYYAIDHSDIADRFLISGDDYFYVKPTDCDTYPIYRKGLLPDTKDGKDGMGGWKYVESLMNTRRLLVEEGLPIVNYSEHAMFYGDRPLMKKFRYLFDKAMSQQYGVVFDTIMSALIVANDESVNVVPRKDLKIKSIEGGAAELRALIGDTEVFSTGLHGMESGFREVLKELYPNKCRFEK